MQSFFNGLSGMTNFSKGLDNVSNNISNMNTPGFKGNDLFIRSLGDGTNNYGSQLSETSVRLSSGDVRQTSSDTDLAITGNGYFILQSESGDVFYTRAGQFKFNEDSQLVDSATGHNVMAISDVGTLEKIDISENKILPPEPTTEIKFAGNLQSTATNGTVYTVNDVVTYDAKGEGHDLKLVFTKSATASNTWQVDIKSESDVVLGTFQIQFDTDSSPSTGFNSISRSISLGGATQAITFTVGNTGSLAGATQLTGESDLKAVAEDGHAPLGLRSLSFDDEGVIEFKYANGDIEKGQQIALALFDDPSTLQQSSSGLLIAHSANKPDIGKPNKELFGSIKGKSLEMSNVDLTQEFADILIIQRGYQASSRVMSVSNDMLEQLYNSTRTK